MANAGRVAIVPKGDYSSSMAYNRLDLVRYNEKAYVAKKANTGILPTNTEYWMLMTSDGITIDTALSDTSTNPVQNKVVKTALDNIQTTSRATLSTAGWYRVAEFTSTIESVRKGSSANSCVVVIKKMHDSKGSEEYTIKLRSVYTSQEFKCEDAKVNGTQQHTKIRYTVDSGKAYIELYSTGTGNTTFVEINSPQNDHATWKAITPTLTSETVDGVTVTTTYDIPANASPVTSVDLANYLPLDGSKAIPNYLDIGNTSTSNPKTFTIKNALRHIHHQVNASGVYYLYDTTNGKNIIISTADGTNTFNGTVVADTSASVTNALYSKNTLEDGSVRYAKMFMSSNGDAYLGIYNDTSEGAHQGPYAQFILGTDKLRYYYNNTPKDVLHTGNKPNGSYTGNGSATSRTIATNGYGNVIAIWCASSVGHCVTLVSPRGAFGKKGSTAYALNYDSIAYNAGTITIATTDGALNESGVTYYYQVL